MKRILVTLIILSSLLMQATAQKDKMQAAYIYQFTKLIKWCDKYSSGDFIIAVLGSSTVTTELNGLAGKMVVNQPIVIKTFASFDLIDKCNILFVPASQSTLLVSINRKLINKCTLIITEKPGLAEKGASINFIDDAGKLVFEVNSTSLSRHLLTANTRLLGMAKKVYALNN